MLLEEGVEDTEEGVGRELERLGEHGDSRCAGS